MDNNLNRREVLVGLGAGSMIGLSGCSEFGSNTKTPLGSSSTTTTESTEVIFTDSNTGTSSVPQETETKGNSIVFDGGDAGSFRKALRTAADNPGSTLRIDQGEYHIGPSEHSLGGSLDAHFEQVGLQDVTIEGNNSKLLFTDPTIGMLHFYGGENLTIQNLSLDYDPTPFTQAEIVSFSPDDRSLIVEIEDGYPAPTHNMFKTDHETDQVWASTHTSDGEFVSELATRDGLPYKKFSEIEQIGGEKYELTISSSSGFTGLAEGRRLAIVARNGFHALHFGDIVPC